MTRSITRLLSKGISHLADGGTVDEYTRQQDVSRLPDTEREELWALLNTGADLLRLQELVVPAPTAKAINRAHFLSEVVQSRISAQARREKGLVQTVRSLLHLLPLRRNRARAPAQLRRGLLGAALALVLLFAMGGGVVSAAAGSLPGSPLYPVKLAVEDARLTLTFSQAARAQLYMRFANERTTEMVRLVTEGRPVDEAVVARMAQQLGKAIWAAESTGGALGRQLLMQVIGTSNIQQNTLRRASAEAAPETRAMLDAGAIIAQQASRQAQEVLQNLPTPAATLTPTWTSTPTRIASEPSGIAPVHTTTATSTKQPALTPLPVRTPPSTFTATPVLSATLPVTYLPTRTRTPKLATALPTRTRPFTPSPGETLEPTHTPQAVFSLTKTDHRDPVPATYRIHYEICVINEAETPLTNVVIVDKWSDCAYLVPDNPPQVEWIIGTVEAYERRCLDFVLNTFSICGGQTVTNEAIMTCDQGTARAVQTTRLGPTPVPVATPTMTGTVTPTLTLTPTFTITPATATASTRTLLTWPATGITDTWPLPSVTPAVGMTKAWLIPEH